MKTTDITETDGPAQANSRWVTKQEFLEAAVSTAMKKVMLIESLHEKNNNLGFRPGQIQNRLYSHSIKLEACHFGYK